MLVNQLANARSKGSDRPSALHLGQTKLPRTLRSCSIRISSLSASKKGLVANLSAKRQLSVAKLSTKRDFSLAKRDFLVANGRMAADFSSPDFRCSCQANHVSIHAWIASGTANSCSAEQLGRIRCGHGLPNTWESQDLSGNGWERMQQSLCNRLPTGNG